MSAAGDSGSVDFFHLDDDLTMDERAIRARVRRFCDDEVVPNASDNWERACFPAQLLPKLADLGIAGGTIREYGCPGMSGVGYGLALQELGRADGSLATLMAVQSSLAMNAIYYCGTEEQRRRWLPGMARLEILGAFGLTEPERGSDATNLLTTARLDGADYVLNGRKRWIGNATICDIAVIWACTDDGKVNGFVVPRDTPGYAAVEIDGKLSQRSIPQADIQLTECRVPAAHRLTGRGGFAGTATTLLHARLGVAWAVLGAAMSCYEIALRQAREREQFGRPIAAFQLVQQKLVHMLNDITLAQLACMHLSRLQDRGQLTIPMVALAKMNHTEMARRTARDARDILGGDGILAERRVMRHLCDLEAAFTYEGTHDINLLLVGREITGLGAFS